MERYSRRTGNSAGADTKVPRPPNSWVLYRAAKQRELFAGLKSPEDRRGRTVSETSKVISKMWKEETQAVKRKFERLAMQAKAEHSLKVSLSGP